MEKRGLIGDLAILQHPFLLIIGLLLGFVFIDPFGMSPVGHHDFNPVKHHIAPFDEVMDRWPKDMHQQLGNANIVFKNEVFGPESLEFDTFGHGPYTGLADGRIVRWMGSNIGWETFAFVTKNWSHEICANGVDSTTKKQWKHERQCGRVLGLRFHKGTGDLYIADAYHGLLVVGPKGGLASPLSTHVDGARILFANDLDIHDNGSIYFTDTSRRYDRVNHFFIMLEGESTGRLLRYDPPTKTTNIILDSLAFPNGVQISKDQRFLLYTETTNCRIMKYWLVGPNAGTVEVAANLPGFPDNVRRNEDGQFWVAIGCCRTRAQEILTHNPWLRNAYFRLPVPMSILARIMGTTMHTIVAKLDEDGKVMEVLEDTDTVVMKLASEVREVNGKLWIGSVVHNHVATLDYPINRNRESR